MPLFDLPLPELRAYRPDRDEPADFDDFWKRTLTEAEAFDLAAEFTPYDAGLGSVDVYDTAFAGWHGHRINAWFLVPRGAGGPVPCVVQFIGYGGGRGHAHDHTVWPAAGYAVLVVDTRGQGGASHQSPGATADPDGGDFAQAPGMMTRGIMDPETYYYRRVFADAARAVDVAAAHPAVDAGRIVVAGGSQGGGIAQAAAALRPSVAAALIDVPFLTHFRRAIEITDRDPYAELVRFLATHRHAEERVLRTLSYFDGVNFAARGTVPAVYSVALMDDICPPSTVFAAYNHWAGPKEISVWPWNGHEGGGGAQREHNLRYLRRLWALD
ncbi:cephalosporin-C deacetylase [Thermocatellispora tengchongensis]|uniref:Cephalosporin-C deacetylase n=1 Tax=Thermocatellispora tengchongensis TaxID=1073253 RepID=A0A840P2Y6_9ACTN|nr:alpha/beta fold hydrolase [Thermocatellispora tengchongensis]MBB5131607.1 cephalosporin-C deacetylase [Thermocatellispora tengchongensis]